MPRRSSRSVALTANVGLVIAMVAACSGAPARSQERFCQRIGDNLGVVTAAVQSPAEASSAISRFRAIGDAAPEAIRDEWDALVQLLVVADDPATSDSALAERAVASQRSVKTIDDYVKATCGVDLVHPVLVTQPPATTTPAIATPAITSAAATPTAPGASTAPAAPDTTPTTIG